MLGIIRSEILKMRHSFSMKLIFAAPLVTVLIGLLLSSNAVQYSAYNWWYTMILPIVVALWAAGTVVREKKYGAAKRRLFTVSLRKNMDWEGSCSGRHAFY